MTDADKAAEETARLETLRIATLGHKPRFNRALIIEPAILFVAVIGGAAMLGHMQQRDEVAKQDDAAKDLQAKCLLHQPHQTTEFNCTIIDRKLAVIK